MKDIFFEYYPPTDDTQRTVYTTGWIVLDTNVLLDLYRTHPDGREAVLTALESVSDRLWVPYQVALEYQENRLGVILGQHKAFDEVLRRVKEFNSTLQKSTATASGEVTSATEAYVLALEEVRESHVASLDSAGKDDAIRDRLDALLAGKVGTKPTADVLAERVKEAQRRMEAKLPPGYKDGSKGGDRGYGDYLIWAEILERAAALQEPILFVTNDAKEDWFRVEGGRKLGPRTELRREIDDKMPSVPYWQVTLSGYLENASRFGGPEVTEATISQVAAALENRAIGEAERSVIRSNLDFMKLLENIASHGGTQADAFVHVASPLDGVLSIVLLSEPDEKPYFEVVVDRGFGSEVYDELQRFASIFGVNMHVRSL